MGRRRYHSVAAPMPRSRKGVAAWGREQPLLQAFKFHMFSTVDIYQYRYLAMKMQVTSISKYRTWPLRCSIYSSKMSALPSPRVLMLTSCTCSRDASAVSEAHATCQQ